MGTVQFVKLVICAAMVGLTLSFANPIISMRAQEAGHSEIAIGASAALSGVGSVVAAMVLPAIVSRFGLRWMLPSSLGLGAVAFVFVGVAPDATTQTMARVVFNAAIVAVFVLCEFQILSIVSARSAGRAAGVYAGVMSLGYMIGPVMIDIVGHRGGSPLLLVGGCLVAGAVLTVMGSSGAWVGRAAASKSVISCLRSRPLSAIASLAFGTIEIAMFTVFPLYGERVGVTVQLMALCLTATALGGALAQIPIGIAADRIGRKPMLALLGVAGVGVTLLIPSTVAIGPALLALMAVWGGVANGVYTVGLSLVSVSVHEDQGVSENAAFVGSYHAGFLIGPLTASASLSFFGSNGFIAFIAGVFALFLLLTIRSPRLERAR